jgi:hypothetical protein
MKKYFFIIASFMIFLSCNSGSVAIKNSSGISYNLKPKHTSQQIEQPIKLTIVDSTNLKVVKLSFFKNGRIVTINRFFKLIGNTYFERRLNNYFDNNEIDTLYTTAFLLKDTQYTHDLEPKKNQVRPKEFEDWEYINKKIDSNEYLLVKKHLHDSSFKEEFVYDELFKLKKINFFHGSDTLMFE